MKGREAVVREDLDYICSNLEEELPHLAGRELLITGGAGFLGYYLVQSALYYNEIRKGAPICVNVLDNYARGVPPWLDRISDDANLTLVNHDVTQPLPASLCGFDYVFHAASIASPTYYRRNPIETMDANVKGLRNLLDDAVRRANSDSPVQGFVFFSTSEIYGDPDAQNIPTPETYRGNVSCTGPRACYDESKRFGETLCVNFSAVYDLPIKMVRPFNNYGPGLNLADRRVIPDFARDILQDRDIVMLSDGAPTRTFCYVADAVVGYYKVLVHGRPAEPYNIGVEFPEISMLELAEKIAALSRELFGYAGQVVRRSSTDSDYLVDNPNRRCPVIAKARADLGYAPTISLEEGLRRSLLWYNGEEAARQLC